MISYVEKLCHIICNTYIELYSERMTCTTQISILKKTSVVDCYNKIKQNDEIYFKFIKTLGSKILIWVVFSKLLKL